MTYKQKSAFRSEVQIKLSLSERMCLLIDQLIDGINVPSVVPAFLYFMTFILAQ